MREVRPIMAVLFASECGYLRGGLPRRLDTLECSPRCLEYPDIARTDVDDTDVLGDK